MFENERFNVNPQQHILDIFEAIKDGKVGITYYPDIGEPYDLNYEIDCTKEEAEELVHKYTALTAALAAIAAVSEQDLENDEKRKELLSAEELLVWEIYIRDFDEKFDVDEDYLHELYQRRECDCIDDDEEYEILERHYEWFDMQCRERLPFEARSPMLVVNYAQRYEYCVRNKAPQFVLNEISRRLAEDMILYYFSKDFAYGKTTMEELFGMPDNSAEEV